MEQSLWLILAAIIGTLFYRRREIAAHVRPWFDSGFSLAWPDDEQETPPMPQPTVPGSGRAALNPPRSLQAARMLIRRERGDKRYCMPLGYYIDNHGAMQLAWASLLQLNHFLITGKSGCGKEGASRAMLFTLALDEPPERIQFALFDGKGLDWASWEGLSHTWMLADDVENFGLAMKRIDKERERRKGILRQAGVTKWDNYTAGDLPMLVVFVTELLLLQDAVGDKELARWLNSNLTSGRAYGMRFIIQTQTASNFSTRWRSQIDLFLAGYQPAGSQDEPNASLTANELRAVNAIPPSDLPAIDVYPGCFTWVRDRRSAGTVRTSYIDDAQIAALVDSLPRSGNPVQSTQDAPQDSGFPESGASGRFRAGSAGVEAGMEAAGSATSREAGASERFQGMSSELEALLLRETGSASRGSEAPQNRPDRPSPVALPDSEANAELADISSDEQERIITAALEESSRRKVCQRVFGTTGGRDYRKVQIVCDAMGLLVTSSAQG